jgi:hypothetical protein
VPLDVVVELDGYAGAAFCDLDVDSVDDAAAGTRALYSSNDEYEAAWVEGWFVGYDW